tara:strand:- start:2193 stop:3461 length:1269 start_codon:yes stop_codon:yes gene_type:complete
MTNRCNVAQNQVWIAVFLAASLYAYEYAQMSLYNSLYVPLHQSFMLGEQAMALLSMSYHTGMLVMYPWVGYWIDRQGPRNILLFSTFGLIAMLKLLVIAPSFEWLLLSRFSMGAFASFTYISCLVWTRAWCTQESMPKATGVICAFGSIGGMISQVVGSWFISFSTWRETLSWGVLFGVVLLIVTASWMLRNNPEAKQLPTEKKEGDKGAFLHSLIGILCEKRAWFCAFTASCLYVTNTLLGAIYGKPYLIHLKGLTPDHAAMVCAALYIGVLLGSLIWPAVLSFVGGEKRALAIGASGTMGMIILTAYSQTLFFLGLAFGLVGFFSSAKLMIFSYVSKTHGKLSLATYKSFVCFGMILSATISPAISFVFAEISNTMGGSVQSVDVVLPLLFVYNIICMYSIYRLHHEHPDVVQVYRYTEV